MKKVLSVVLAFAMVLSLAPTGVLAQTVSAATIEGEGGIVVSDACGDNVTWTLYESGFLHISGTGDMYNWNFWDTSAPWIEYASDIHKVVIEEGVTSIGMNAFCSEEYNGYVYESLTDIVIPNTVTTIQTNGISGVYALETITIPASVTTLVGAAFNNIYELKEYVVDEQNPAFQAIDGVLYSKDGKTLLAYPIGALAATYVVPQGTETIAAYAFSQCQGLTGIEFNEELKKIDDEAFHSCTGLRAIELPDGFKEFGGGVFQECQNLAEISLPTTLTRIGARVFDATAYYNNWENWTEDCVLYLGSYLLDTVYMPWFLDWDEWKEKEGTLIVRDGTTLIADESVDSSYTDAVVFNKGLQHIGFCAFGWLDLTSAELPDSLLTLGDWAFYNCASLQDIYIGDNLQYIGHDAFGKTPYDNADNYVDGVLYYGPYVLGFDNNLPQDVVLRDGTTLIAERAFWKEDGSLNTPDYGAAMRSIALPESLTTICDGAFYSCMNLKTLTVPATVTTIGDQAFGWIKGYDRDIEEETFEKMTDVTVEGYNGTAAQAYAAKYDFPFVSLDAPPPEVDEVYGTVVQAGACGLDVSWKLYDSGALVITGEGEMDDFGDDVWCTLPITRVVIDDGVSRIGSRAFEDCDSIETIEIGRDVRYIGQYAFRCDNLQSFTVSEDNVYYSVADGVLFNKEYSDLLRYPPKKAGTSYAVPYGVYALEDGAFESCLDLTSVSFTETTTSFGDHAFAGSGLTSILLPENMTIVDSYVFQNCLSLTSVIVPHPMRDIGYYAFDGCTNLTDVYYASSQEEAEQRLFIYNGNAVFSNARWHYEVCQNDPAKTHDYTPATCFEPKTCKNCRFEQGFALEHEPSEEWSFDGDVHGHACIHCGQIRDGEPHSLDAGVVTKQPTCDEYGIKTYTCSVCHASLTELIDKNDTHTYTNSCDATCDVCGESRDASHDYKAATCTEPETCRQCGDTRGIKLGHFYSVPCDTQCDRCGESRTVSHIRAEATCTAPEYCIECGTIFSGELGHTYSHDCDKTCNRCGVSRTTSHTYESVVSKATLTKDGKIDYRCTVCGYVSSKPKTISRPTSFALSTTAYTYNGTVKTPNVTVKDSAGKTLVKNTDYTVSYASGRKNAGTYKVTVTMKGKYSGTKTLSFKINPISVSKCTFKLSKTSYAYDGKVKAPSVTVKNAGGTTLKKDTHYTVTYASGRKNVGTYKVTVKMKGNYSGTKTLTFKVVPRAASINTLTAKSKALTVKLNRSLQQSTGYQIQYATNKNFTSAKTKTISDYKTSTTTLSSLKAKTTYYVRVRTYKKDRYDHLLFELVVGRV